MARNVAIDDQMLIEVAREVFLEQGFAVKTTEIAARAGVSSGSIFRRFADKEALFLAAMQPAHSWVEELDALVARDDLKQTLEDIARLVLEDAREQVPRTMMLWAQRLDGDGLLKQKFDQQDQALALFLNQHLELGRLRPSLDTWATARVITGTMHYLAWLETFGEELEPDLVHTFIDTLWKGLIANPESF